MKALLHVIQLLIHAPNIIIINIAIKFTTSAPEDFTARLGVQVTFAPGQQSQTVQVATVGDTRYEGDESFSAILSLPTNSEGVVLGDQDTATATIQDDDRESD